MHELVTVPQADALLRTLGWLGPAAGVLMGALAGMARGRLRLGALQGLLVGLLGPVVWGLWLLYESLVRYHPESGRAGLHSVAVLGINALIFVLVGAALGLLYSRVVFAGPREEKSPATAKHAPDECR